jgi:cytochrome c biogenesis protein CcmG, thiol:disulfide interchange protein DsbE
MTVLPKISSLLTLMLVTLAVSAQETPLDSAQLKTVKGQVSPFSTLAKKEPVILICFWSVNSDPSMNELNAINAQYTKWKEAAPFKLMAVCIDAGNLLNRMRPTANGNGWTFDVYADINGDLQKFFSINDSNLPVSLVLDKEKVVYRQSGFDTGTENYLFTKIQALAR